MNLSSIRLAVIVVTLVTMPLVSQISAQDSPKGESGVEGGQRVSAPPLQSGEHSPEAVKLLAKIREQESAAEAFAKAIIRDHKEKGTGDAKIPEDRQRKLKEMLTAVFDLKLQVEELQVKELQSRLGRFEQQIRQRREFRDKIVEHRTSQLIEQIGLQWDPSESKRENQAQVSTKPVDPTVAAELAQYESGGAKILQAVLDRQFPNSSIKCVGLIGGNILLTGEYDDPLLHKTILEIARLHAPEVIDNTREIVSNNVVERNPSLSQSATDLREVLKKHFPDSWIECYALIDGNMLLTGEILDENTAIQIAEIARHYASTIINHMRIKARVVHPSKGEAPSGLKAAYPDATDTPGIGGGIISDKFPSPEKLREQLETSAKRLTAAVNRVRELETRYFRDGTGAEELKKALTEFNEARRDFRERLEELNVVQGRVQEFTDLQLQAINARWESVKSQLPLEILKGTANETIVNKAMKSRDQSNAELSAQLGKYLQLGQTAAYNLLPQGISLEDNPMPAIVENIAGETPNVRLDLVRAWLEFEIGSKLELVRCHDLNLWFKSALRVSESSRGNSGRNHNAGDLIVLINDHTFDSWDQVVIDSKVFIGSKLEVNDSFFCTILKDGFTGTIVDEGGNPRNSDGSLKPSQIPPSIVRIEVQLQIDGSDKTEVKYLTGTCISPEGLVVIPISSKSIAERSAISASSSAFNNNETMTANVVGSDDEHALTLLKLEPSNPQLFSWLKCRTALPSENQELNLWNNGGRNNVGQCLASEINRKLPMPLVGDDAFVVTAPAGAPRFPNGQPITPRYQIRKGNPICAFNGDLQGIVIVAPEESEQQTDDSLPRPLVKYIALPALHVENLLNKYLRTTIEK